MSTYGQRSSVVLVVPTLNEAGAIGMALKRVPRELIDQIIVTDGGSSDATVAEAAAAGARVIAAGRGYGRACLAGALAADRDSIVVFMDGDGSDRVESVELLLAPIISGRQDFVIGSRVRGARARGSMGWHQVFIGLVIGALIALRYGVRYTDMCAFRAIRRAELLALGMNEMTYGWNLEMQMRAARAKLRILEIPVPYDCRSAGSSKVSGNWRGALRASARLLITFLKIASERTLLVRSSLVMGVLLASLPMTDVRAQEPAPPGSDLATFAAKRFPQPVRVGDLIHRDVLRPTESRSEIGRVEAVVKLGDAGTAIVIRCGGFLGFGERDIAVPVDAMVLLGNELEVLDLTPEQLRQLPTYRGTGHEFDRDDIIHMGLAHPSH